MLSYSFKYSYYNVKKYIVIISISIFSAGLYKFLPVEKDVAKGLAILFLIAALWITESLPITVTALTVPLIASFTGIFDVKSSFTHFANPIIFLFLGGFALAAALHKQNMDELIAKIVLQTSKNNVLISIIMLFLVTAVISMWISNTATTAMMLPIALGLIYRINKIEDKRVNLFILLGLAYSANIGGIATIVGSPPNGITAANLNMGFSDWLYIGVPSFVILFPVVISFLYFLIRPGFLYKESSEDNSVNLRDYINKNSALVVIIFFIAVALWLLSKPLSSFLEIKKGFDSLVAVFALLLLTLSRVVSWKEIEKFTDWGVLLLFGGGITLSAILSETGASRYLANILYGSLIDYGFVVLLFGAAVLMIFLTEIASNTASAAILVPIFLAVGAEIPSVNQNVLPLAIGIAASCAFMLPVATPPNAIVFGTGKVDQKSMMKIGLKLNFICAAVICLIAYFVIG
ncbi:MAG: DASS family sodium-coupled anion symporter [Candidatus Dadabacteria bacterium]|nr:DASS family sodium-coupled anion symporter [Candidatus Dadabacteria bacterium]NIS08046.1 DASS family sodium-coupled anion symporter [Candidatus Dadabacteria bacterium]NIV40869.1 DASS family sodium-coupled anion symporter [Candidatus Dadabacteria bacterium]NIY21624.1 DASS family sodium-coupled anion symporter [Candidatus Dadabacteria bacterium]